MKIRLTTLLAASALALVVFAAPTFAAEAANAEGLLPAPGAEVTAATLPAELTNETTLHLGSGAEADFRRDLILQSSGLGDPIGGCFDSGWECGPWYRTGGCCTNPEADKEASNCQRHFVCPGGGGWTEYMTMTKCVGVICH